MATSIWPTIHAERTALADDLADLRPEQWTLPTAIPRESAPPGPKDTWLGENFLHGEDIRRALGMTRAYPLDQVTRTVAFYAGSEPIIGGKTRCAGLTLAARRLRPQGRAIGAVRTWRRHSREPEVAQIKVKSG